MSTSDLAKPTIESRRIASIDVLRGLAMLGILVLNIQAFAMPFEAYGNPFAYGDIEGSNYWVFTFAMLLADMKFMAIFSLLFGAGMVLFVERLLETGRPAYAVHYRRMAWLLVIGLVHAYLIWYGDILVGYALCGMVVVWCRRFRPWLLCVLGLCLIAVCSVLMLGSGALIVNFMPEKLAMTAHGSQQQLESIAWQLESYTGSWSDQFSHRGSDCADGADSRPLLLHLLACQRPDADRHGAVSLGCLLGPAFQSLLSDHACGGGSDRSSVGGLGPAGGVVG